jgi:TPR repeat protein
MTIPGRLALIALLLTATASAGDVDDGLRAFQARDYAAAYAAWLPDAERGDATARFYLGVLYEHGYGVRQDFGEAVAWYRQSADAGNPHAQFNLGILHARGEGVPADPVEAYKWLNLAAAQGKQGARDARDSVRGRMTEEQVQEAQKRSREWKPRRE